MHGVTEWAFLIGAGVLAGVIGTAGGITSLVSYPALLAVGFGPLTANVTNSVALLGSGASSAFGARPDIAGHRGTLRRWVPPTVALSLGGALLLVLTPAGVFARIVPFLVAAGSVVLLVQPMITRWQSNHGAHPDRTIRTAAAGVAVYNGYFGAGSGILLIAVLLLAEEPVLHRANALKNVILVAADVLPAVLFALVGTVVWHAVWPLGTGALLGGLIGPVIARRVPAAVLRPVIAACGLALAVELFLRP